MSLKNLRSGKIGPPPSKWDTEYVNRIRREIESHNGLIPNAPGQPMFLTFTDGINFTYGITGSAFDQGIVSGDNGSLLTVAYDTNYPFNHGIDKRPLVSPDSSISINVTDKVGLTDGQIQLQVSAYSVLSALSVDSIASDDYLPFEDVSGSDINKVTITDFFDQSWTSGALHYQEVQNAGSGLTKRRAINLLSPLEAADNGGTGLTELRLNASAADKYLYSTAADTWTEGSITTTGRSLVASASASAARDTLDASSGVWPATIGGTGLSSYTTGDLLYASASNTLSKLAAGTSGNFLKQGASVPSWAALAASDIASGQLALARGGTAADLSATGGTSQFLRQSSAGAAITVSAIAHADLGSGGGSGTKYLRDDMSWQTLTSDHGALTGLSDDDHTQYALLAGRSGGQTLIGGTASGNNLTLKSSSHATKGNVIFGNAGTTAYDEVNERFGIGTATPARALEVRSTTAQLRLSYDDAYGVDFAVSIAGNLSIVTTAGSGGAINIGRSSAAAGANTPVAIGVNSSAAGSNAVALGVSASASSNVCVAIGNNCVAGADYSIALGYSADAITGGYGIAIGTNTQASGANATALGQSANASGGGTIALGQSSAASATNGISIGASSVAAGSSSVSVGPSANCNSSSAQGIAIGSAAKVTAAYGICLGYNGTTSASDCFAVGSSVAGDEAGSIIFGGSTAYANMYAGKGRLSASPTAWTLNGTGGSGTNIAGANLKLAGGKPTGSGAGGSVIVQTAPAGASGTTLRSLSDRLTIDQLGNIYPGTAALATGATDGFIYLQSCAGAPSGTPTTVTGRVPTIIDTTNGRLYAYYGGAWHYTTFT